jgi:tetratricopeptide (TPR) repeat protein
MLLDFLERKAALPSATFVEVREGVELALGRRELSRAEALLRRAVELARANAGDRKALEWALLELAEVRRSAGDLAGAVACLEEARDVADPARVLRLYQELAAGRWRTAAIPPPPPRCTSGCGSASRPTAASGSR